jgi:hypothetical protein
MTNKILNQLFLSCKKWKTLVLISMLLTLGVGQMWAYNWVTLKGNLPGSVFNDWSGGFTWENTSGEGSS